MPVRTIDLTTAEWSSLRQLPADLEHGGVPAAHRTKLMRLGVAAEKAGNLVATFEGRLMLREHIG